MPAGKDLYKLLGVKRDASPDEIKSAFKQAALKYHPDRVQGDDAAKEVAAEKFREMSNAFEILSDKEKRDMYDKFGEEGVKAGPVPPGGENPFAGFGGGFPGGGFSNNSGSTFTFTSSNAGGPGGVPDIFETLFSSMGGAGGKASSGMPGGFSGMPFGGMGGMNGMNFEDLHGSSGPRRERPRAQPPRQPQEPKAEPPEFVKHIEVSLEDLYNGTSKNLKVTRKFLDGHSEASPIQVVIQPGMKAGTKMTYREAGSQKGVDPETGAPIFQNLVIVIDEKKHDRFTREDADLVTKMKIPLVEALSNTGGTKTVKGVDGSSVEVSLPSGVIKPGSESRVIGKGMPKRKAKMELASRGDLVVRWEVVFPDRLTASQREGVRKVLS